MEDNCHSSSLEDLISQYPFPPLRNSFGSLQPPGVSKPSRSAKYELKRPVSLGSSFYDWSINSVPSTNSPHLSYLLDLDSTIELPITPTFDDLPDSSNFFSTVINRFKRDSNLSLRKVCNLSQNLKEPSLSLTFKPDLNDIAKLTQALDRSNRLSLQGQRYGTSTTPTKTPNLIAPRPSKS